MATEKVELFGLSWEAEGGEEFVAKEREAVLSFLLTPLGGMALELADDPGAAPAPAPTIPGYKARRVVEGVVDPADLREAIDNGRGNEVLHLYDEITIPLDNGKTVTVVCAFVGDEYARFVFKDCYDQHCMNEEATNKGSYYHSAARRYVLEEIYPHLPRAWKDVIRPRQIVEVIDGEERSYTDPLWLPSATDVLGSPEDKWWPDEVDSFQLPIFLRECDRVKELDPEHENYDGTCYWWLRSPYATNTSLFCFVNTNGSADDYAACYSRGFAPGFDL
jgi:hypothetical protein